MLVTRIKRLTQFEWTIFWGCCKPNTDECSSKILFLRISMSCSNYFLNLKIKVQKQTFFVSLFIFLFLTLFWFVCKEDTPHSLGWCLYVHKNQIVVGCSSNSAIFWHSATEDWVTFHIPQLQLQITVGFQLSDVQFILRFSSEEVAWGWGNNFRAVERGRGGGGGTRISRLSNNVESKIMICLWHTIFETKRTGLCSPFWSSWQEFWKWDKLIKINYNAYNLSNIIWKSN